MTEFVVGQDSILLFFHEFVFEFCTSCRMPTDILQISLAWLEVKNGITGKIAC